MASSDFSSDSSFPLPNLSSEDLSQLPEDSTIWTNLKQAIAV